MSYEPIKHNMQALKKLLLSDEASQKEYDKLSEEFLIIAQMLKARKAADKTQKQVASEMKTSSSVISRLESLEGHKNHSPTLDTLKKYAHAVNCILSIEFISKAKKNYPDRRKRS